MSPSEWAAWWGSMNVMAIAESIVSFPDPGQAAGVASKKSLQKLEKQGGVPVRPWF